MGLTNDNPNLTAPEVSTGATTDPGSSIDATKPRAIGRPTAGATSGQQTAPSADQNLSQEELDASSSIETNTGPEEKGWLDSISEGFDNLTDNAVETFHGIKDGIVDTFHDTKDAVVSVYHAASDLIEDKGVIGATVHVMTAPAKYVADLAANSDIGFVRSIGNSINSGISFARNIPTDSLISAFSYIGSGIKSATTSIVSTAYSLFTSPGETISKLVSNFLSGRPSEDSPFSGDFDSLGRPIGPITDISISNKARGFFGQTAEGYGAESVYAIPTDAQKEENSGANGGKLEVESGRVSLRVEQIAAATVGADATTLERIAATGSEAIKEKLHQPHGLATTKGVEQLMKGDLNSTADIANELSEELKNLKLPKVKRGKDEEIALA